jgi:hypothetical protein
MSIERKHRLNALKAPFVVIHYENTQSQNKTPSPLWSGKIRAKSVPRPSIAQESAILGQSWTSGTANTGLDWQSGRMTFGETASLTE